jgi:hypothetical protein
MGGAGTAVRCDASIPWSLWDSRERVAEAISGAAAHRAPFGAARHEHWGPTGRWLLGAWLAQLGLDRSDVITIITTSQERYVSICVSVTAFNHASVSRVITDRTRVIIWIHEFGYVDTSFPDRCAQWRAAGIAVLEDCAHVAGLTVGPATVGDYGDAALYSLPKLVPARAGGLLRARQPVPLPAMNEAQAADTAAGRAVAEEYSPYLARFNDLRQERHLLLCRELGLPVVQPPQPAVSVPWFATFSDPGRRIDQAACPGVFWGSATLEPHRVQIPTNPLVPLAEYKALIDHVRGRPGAAAS